MRKYETAPHPFVLEADAADPLRLGFTLFGQANRHLPVFIHALTQAAAGARGVYGNVMELIAVEQALAIEGDAWHPIFARGQPLTALPVAIPVVPPVPLACVVNIQTPLRVKRDGRHVGPLDFTFADLFGNLLRRISMLTYFHSETPLTVDFRALTEISRTIPMRRKLHWVEHTRYSKRQQMKMQMGGVMGRMTLANADLSPFWPYLWLGQFTHAGAAATMGMGRYRILASLQDATDASV